MEIAPTIIAYLIPVGIVLTAWGSWDEHHARHDATVALLVMALAVLVYALLGFALNFGGVGLRPDVPPGLHGLDLMWSPVASADSRYWGVIGLEGFLLEAAGTVPGDTALLFPLVLHQLPIVLAATLVPTLALAGRVRPIVVVTLSVLFVGLIAPLIGAWTWGGGWLFNLGRTADFGHGFIDAGSAASTFAAAGVATLAALLALKVQRPIEYAIDPPPALWPLRAILGAIFFGLGLLAWLATDPILTLNRSIDLALLLTHVIIGAAAATVVTFALSWFTTGKPHPQLTARGVLAGCVASLAAAPFVPTWAAMLTGALAGGLTVLGMFAVQRWLQLDDEAGFTASLGLAGLWSIIAVGVFANGAYGAGWNDIGASEYLGVPGQGITGVLTPSNLPGDPGQLSAQITGAVAILAITFIVTWLIMRPLRSFVYRDE